MHVTVDVSSVGAGATTQYFGINAVRLVKTSTGLGMATRRSPPAPHGAVTIAGLRRMPAAATVKAVMAQVSASGSSVERLRHGPRLHHARARGVDGAHRQSGSDHQRGRDGQRGWPLVHHREHCNTG